MSTPAREEPASAEKGKPAAEDAAVVAAVVVEAPPPVVAPSNLVMLGGADAPACAGGVCW